ncbi:MAG: Lrp/AsnC ligand binding domain-containing protein [Proteobacteria bacterium]|nr:Lrp/AsnC ligand binding domain-containing protein [Pseudomonadota bacterium]
MSVTAVVLIKAKTRSIGELAAALAELDGVVDVYSVAGRYDLVAIVRAKRNEEIADIVSDRMHALPGIEDSETLISFRVYRKSDVEAGFGLGLDE